jgi:hypothetical protein
MFGRRINTLRAGTFAAVLLASTSLAAQGVGGAPGGGSVGGPGGTAGAPGTVGSPQGTGPTINTGPLGPGGTRLAPGPSGAGIPVETIGPGGTPIAPGPAGTLGGGGIGTLGGPSTAFSGNCVPDTTRAGSGRSGATVGMGPTPTIIAPEPGRSAEVQAIAPSQSTIGAGGSLPPC